MSIAARAHFFRALVGTLIVLLPLQGIAAGVLAVLGPAHFHRTTDVQLELDDLRRSPIRKAPRIIHGAGAFGHFHGVAEPMRHLHSHGDPTVVRTADDAASPVGDGEGPNASPALGALIPPLPCEVAWRAPEAIDVIASGDAWPVLTHVPKPFERPPRRG